MTDINKAFIDELVKIAKKTDHTKDTAADAIAGAGSGAIATAATLPLETLQIAESVSKKGKKELIRDLYHEGKTILPEEVAKLAPSKAAKIEKLIAKGKIVKGEDGKLVYTGMKGVAKGVGRFYKGLDTKILKVAPTMGISFAAYQGIKKSLSNDK